MKKISNKKMILLVVISFLMTFCLSLTISSYAKYSTSLSNVQDSKNVAKWDVSANLPNANITIAPAGESTYELRVSSNSDVALSYDIKVENVQKNCYIILDNTSHSKGDTSFTFSNVGTINTNVTTEKVHTLKFKVAPNVNEGSKQVKIEVIFKQKNPS